VFILILFLNHLNAKLSADLAIQHSTYQFGKNTGRIQLFSYYPIDTLFLIDTWYLNNLIDTWYLIDTLYLIEIDTWYLIDLFPEFGIYFVKKYLFYFKKAYE